MADEHTSAFPDPLSIPTPEGCEGWEEMYPYYAVFSEDRADYERSKFWFQNRYHLMDPLKPFDLVTPEFCYIAIANRNNRIFQLPPSTGVDFRIVNGYGYLSGNPILDPEQLQTRAETFGQRAGHYYENWSEIEKDWMERTKAEIAKLEALEMPELPDLEDMSLVTNHQAHGAGYEMHQYFNRLMEAKHLAWHFHMEMILIGFGAYHTFFEFCQQAFPEIDKQSIANMVITGMDTTMNRADDELKRLAQVAVELDLDETFNGGGSADETFERLRASDAGRKWLEEYDKSKYPWFMVNTGDGMYSHDRAWIDDPRMIVTGVRGYIADLRAGKDLSRPQDRQRAEGERVAQAYRDLLESDDDRKAFDDMLGLARLVSLHIEGHKFYIEHWWHGLFYNKVRDLSRVFVQYGFWPDTEDIFYLHQTEVYEALLDMLLSWAGEWPARGSKYWPPIVQRRREIIDRLRDWTPPPALGPVPEVVGDPVLSMLWGIDGDALREWAAPVDADTRQVRGTAASSGVAEGPARVVHGVDQMDTVQEGEILIAPTTNPSWTPVFSRIAACVADGGGMMSHAAIVCREHGLPAIVGSGKATRAIKTGQRVRVDGNTGVVTILDD
ncbi:MAG TPA: PEP-utilizing enzyme [Jiangellaceae bacterium]